MGNRLILLALKVIRNLSKNLKLLHRYELVLLSVFLGGHLVTGFVVGDTVFPFASWNLYSVSPDIDGVRAYRIEGSTEGKNFIPIPSQYAVFNETTLMHAFRKYEQKNQFKKIEVEMRKLFRMSKNLNMGFTKIRFVKFRLVKGDSGKYQPRSEVIVEVGTND